MCRCNWSAGVPNSLSPAYINNGGTARVFVAGTVAEHVYLGDNVGDQGTLEINGGALELPQPRGGTAVVGNYGNGALYIHDGGKLTARFSRLGAYENAGGNAVVNGSARYRMLSNTGKMQESTCFVA